jgi:hypothetical protein
MSGRRFDDSQMVHAGIGKAPARVRLPDSNHSQSPSLLTEQPPMGSSLSSEDNRVVCPYAMACWAPEVSPSCFQIGTVARN